MIDLLPCPFCGKPAQYKSRRDESLWSHDIVTWHEVWCCECDFLMDQCDDADELERRWNTRNGVLQSTQGDST